MKVSAYAQFGTTLGTDRVLGLDIDDFSQGPTGTIKTIQFDLIPISTVVANALALKAPIASPTFTGIPAAPTAAVDTNTTQLATTAFVQQELNDLINGAPGALDTLLELASALANDPVFATTMTNALALKAPLLSPALTGIPTAPTAAPGTNTTQLATTAFVIAQPVAAHRVSHISGGTDAFLTTDLLEAIVKRLQTTTGPTNLTIGAVADGQFLKRVGATIIGAAAGGGGGATATRTVVTASQPARLNQRINIIDAAITGTEKVKAWISGIADGLPNAGDLVDMISCRAIANAGSIDVDMDFLSPWCGSLSLDYVAFA